MSVNRAQLVELYLAYVGRPPDVPGLNFYLNGDWPFGDVVHWFYASPESTTLYHNSAGADQINAIYQNLFNRDAEAGGMAFWLDALATGRVTSEYVALAILQSAQNSDITAVQNKLALTTAFLEQLDTNREIAGFAGDHSAALARAFVETVDASPESLAAAMAILLAQVDLATGLPPAPPPPPPPAPAP
ncbi:DUF4214 domain-containing protein, partial [Ramlibacter sp. WS9]|uniref:DUF4214 domain-containing protein n=1 Tax=Ramlibacter sp. WS9 TaxID=1882741 RepID=UPI001144B396